MKTVELRSTEAARTFLLQSHCLQLATVPSPATSRAILDWAVEMTAEGYALPPLGFVADVGRIALGLDRENRNTSAVAGVLSAGFVRRYEDYVLGKLYSDPGFSRAADAVRRLTGRDRNRGMAYLVHRISERLAIAGVLLGPASVKALQDSSPSELIAAGWDSIQRDGLADVIRELYDDLLSKARQTAELVEPEDIFELEHGTALADLAERVALRQVIHAAAQLESAVSNAPPPQVSRQQDAPTRFLDESAYPVGGFASIANRGSLESLLHSQLAYMETGESADRPDLFDVKFLRDELLYYSRDENEFFRHRRSFIIVLQIDLTSARYKDRESPYQRIIWTLAFIVAAVRKTLAWLDAEAIEFAIVIPLNGEKHDLSDEVRVLQLIFHDEIEAGTVRFQQIAEPIAIEEFIETASRRSQARTLFVGSTAATNDTNAFLQVNAARPVLNGIVLEPKENIALDWANALEQLLIRWM